MFKIKGLPSVKEFELAWNHDPIVNGDYFGCYEWEEIYQQLADHLGNKDYFEANNILEALGFDEVEE